MKTNLILEALEIGLDCATDHLSGIKLQYAGGYYPHRIEQAEKDVATICSAIAAVKRGESA